MSLPDEKYLQYFNLGYDIAQKKVTIPREILAQADKNAHVQAVVDGMNTLYLERESREKPEKIQSLGIKRGGREHRDR